MTLALNPIRILNFLILVIVVLTILNLIGIYFRHVTGYEEVKEHLVRLVYFDDEQNIPTFFSSLILLFSALLLSYITMINRRKASNSYYYWLGLAVIFIFLSLDEAVSLHETFIGPVRVVLNTEGFLYFAWVVPYGIITIAIAVLYIRFLRRLPRKITILMIVSGGIYITGAIVLEMIGGNYYSHSGQERDYIFSLIATLEEMFEMTGIALFIYCLLVYLMRLNNGREIKLRIEEKPEELQNS